MTADLNLPPAREDAIARLAAAIGARFGGGRVEPETIAASLGIPFRFESFPEDFDGALLYRHGRFFIVCNNRLYARGTPRARFTFAHELGHYFIPEHRAQLQAEGGHFSRVDHRSHSPFEREADLFAAHLLMPPALMLRGMETASGTALERILHVAELCGTSVTATAFRALALDLLPAPAAVVRWNQVGELVGRRVSDRTAALGPEYKVLADRLPEESVTARAMASLEIRLHSGTSHAMAWFPRLSGYKPTDQEQLIEEVQPLASHGWLTVLHHPAG